MDWMEQVNKGLGHWNDQLKNLKSHEKFLWDYCDKSLYKKCIYKEVFDKEIGNTVSDICKNNNLLIYTFLVSTLKVTLSKYMGKNNIAIGIPCYSNQNMRGNVHINKLLPLVSYIDPEMTYLEYMGSIKAKVLENYKNQSYLSSKILVQNGLVNDVMELSPISICMKGLHEDIDINYICESSKNELSFLLDPMKDKSIGIKIVYNSNKITEDTVKALYQSYETALIDILNNYNKKIKDIKILSQKDMEKILHEFNDTKADYPKDKTIHELFQDQVEKTPDNIAVIFEDKKLTYRELNERSNSLARVLRDKGVKADSIVGIVVERSLEMIVGIMGILKAGGAYLPIDPNYPKGRIEYMLKDSGCRVLLSKNDLVETIEFNGEIIDLYDENLFNRGSSNLEKINNSTKLAYIIYTSGTTGKPKGAMIEHRSLVNRLNWMQKKYPITEKDTILQKTTYTFDVSVWEILWWSLVGAKVCMLTPNGEKDPMKIIETIDKYEVTTMHFVPSMLDVFLYCVEENRNNINLSSLRQVFSSGEALNFKQVSKFYKEFETGKKLINLYGPTEATIDVAYFDCASDGKRIIPIGKPIDNTELYILKNNELVPIGVAGELYIAGHGLARGYVNRPELTDEKFVDNPFEHGTKMYKTGDLARWLPDGNIEFLGRIDNQVKIRGFRIELGEIENRLLQHENIKEAAVLVKENKDSEKYICAYVVSDKKLQELDLKGYLKETLPEYMVPAYFVQVEKMPLKTNGKLERRALPEPNLDVTLTEYEAPRNKVEETLSKIWSEILGVEKVGINDNFFDLGGHSLKATMLMAKIHKELNKEVPLKELFKMPTIKELSQYIKNAEESPYSKIEKVEEKEYYEASSAQKRMYMLQQFDKNSTAYNMPVAFELKGEVDKWRVEEAFKKLVKRHEALRTYFQSNSSEIVQKVQKNYTFELMSKKEEGDIESIIDNFVRPFNLEKAPLFRVELIENENKTYLLIDMHHIISDGTSMGILIKDFENLYNQQDLDLLKLQYKDFAAWQNGLLKSQDMKKQEQYWINMFSDEIPVLNMPTDYKRPDVQSFEGDSVKFVIDKDTTIELKNLAKETGATIYMVLLSAVNILLSKYSGQEDVIVGSPIAGRKQENLQNIIGMFVNTLSMRNYPLGNKTYEEFLTEVKTNCLKAYENQEYQFEELVEKLNLKRYSNRNPVFDVMFILQNMKQYGVKLNNCSIEQYAYKNKTSKFDLLFIATEYEEKINFEIQYCSGLFKQDTVEKMIKRFKKVLSNITNNRHVQISEIDVLLDEERKKLLIEFNNTDVLYDNTITIKELFEERVEKTPNDVALVFKNKTMTYNDVNEYSNNLASYLFHHGNVGNNSKVGILMERSELMIIAILATLKVGGTYVPIDPQYPIDRIKIIAEDCEIRNMISSKEQIPILNKLQWECSKFQNYICLNCNNVYDVEEFNDSNFMSEDLWNHVVSSSSSKIGEGGWKSSYNGQEFSCEEMKEYSENTLYKLKPYINKDSKVLEIGCASGLTMFEIAPHVNEYFGTDMSGAVIERNSERVEKGCIKNIKLKCLKAHEINEIDDGDFDVIIINSVIQYFPGHNYLRSIIEKSLNLLKDKGIIYIGDIMDSELKEDLIESLNEFKRNNSSHGNKTKIQFDSELFVPRAYFEDIAIDFQEINKIEFSKKIHTIENELTKFRYDCVIEVSKSHSRKCIDKKYKYQHGLMDLMKYKNIPYISNIKSSDLAYILYTSGSTGKPKGVEVQHKAVVNFINGIVSSINFTNKNAILCATNISFDIFVLETLLPLILGLKIVIADEEEQINPQLLKKLIHDWNIDVLQVTPSRMQMIINEDKAVEELKKLKIILVGGEPLKETLLKSLSQTTNASIYNMYGPTETTVWSTFSKQSFTEQITIGKPINNTQIYILDKYMKLVPIGTSGEMYISGDGLAKGYVNNTELTAEKFIKNPFKLQGKMYKTGDFARWLPDGNIEFLGRIDNQVKIRGFRIELGEIENRLLQHEYIKGVVVLVKENKKNDKKICAYVVGEKNLNDLNLKSYVKEKLPDYMIPDIFVDIDEIPLTTNGKVDKKSLPEPVWENNLTEYQAPTNEIEERLVKVWSQVLGKEKIGINCSFFEIGGNSLNTLNLAEYIHKEFDVKIKIIDIFSYPLLKEQAELIESKINFSNSVLEIDEYIKNEISKDCSIQFIKNKGDIEITTSDKEIEEKIKKHIYENYSDKLKNSIACSKVEKSLRKIQVNEINKIILEAKQNCEEISNVISNRANLKYIDFFGTLKNQFSLKRKSLLQMNVVLNSVDFIELKNRLKNFINKHELLRTHITCEDEKYFFLTCDKVEDIPIYVVELLNCTHEDALESKLKILNELRVDFVKKSFLNEILWNWVIFKEDDNFEVFIIIDHKISDGFAEGIIKRDLLKESKKLINSEIDSYFEYVDVTRKSMTQEKIDLYYNSEDYNKLKNSVNNFLNNSDKENHNNESAYRRAFKYKILEDISYNNEEKERIAFNLIVNMCGVLFNTNEIPIRVTRHGRHFDNKNYIGATRCNMKRIA